MKLARPLALLTVVAQDSQLLAWKCGPTAVVSGTASGDGYKDRAALRDKVFLAARVCLKHMVSSNKPAVFASVTDS